MLYPVVNNRNTASHSCNVTEPATASHSCNVTEPAPSSLLSPLPGDVMILEADVTVMGYGTPDVQPVPIMAHPPDVYSDNTLDEWLDAVLASRKAMKLDFKALESVGLSLDLLNQKNSSGRLNRPVWLNADILLGPNTPSFIPPLVQEKFPDATFNLSFTYRIVSWLILRFFFNHKIKPVGLRHSLFSLTLWQGSIHPNVSDLLFVRDNSNPARVYYDIYEPTLSEFKEAASKERAGKKMQSSGGCGV
uniref:Protein FAM151A n=1 Tax=Stegastes partitus TaxID=144197 RepID=A0A3B5A8S3_9TELE